MQPIQDRFEAVLRRRVVLGSSGCQHIVAPQLRRLARTGEACPVDPRRGETSVCSRYLHVDPLPESRERGRLIRQRAELTATDHAATNPAA